MFFRFVFVYEIAVSVHGNDSPFYAIALLDIYVISLLDKGIYVHTKDCRAKSDNNTPFLFIL